MRYSNQQRDEDPSGGTQEAGLGLEGKRSYETIKVIGSGTFGKAILVRNKYDDSLYVKKQINLREMNEKERSGASTEVNILKLLRHPFIIGYHDCYEEEGGYLNIVMDYAENGDLHTFIKKQKGPVPEKLAIRWFVQLTMALKHVHDNNILHRDLKTQNIFLTCMGKNIFKSKIQLGDFGIAKVLNSDTEFAKTVIGTPYYLSPEICEDKPYNAKSDVWALGCVLYELLTRRHAFNGKNLPALIMKILRGKYPPVPSIYSKKLINLISAMLKKNPGLRPTVDEILSLKFVRKTMRRLISEELEAFPNLRQLHPLPGSRKPRKPRRKVSTGLGDGVAVRSVRNERKKVKKRKKRKKKGKRHVSKIDTKSTVDESEESSKVKKSNKEEEISKDGMKRKKIVDGVSKMELHRNRGKKKKYGTPISPGEGERNYSSESPSPQVVVVGLGKESSRNGKGDASIKPLISIKKRGVGGTPTKPLSAFRSETIFDEGPNSKKIQKSKSVGRLSVLHNNDNGHAHKKEKKKEEKKLWFEEKEKELYDMMADLHPTQLLKKNSEEDQQKRGEIKRNRKKLQERRLQSRKEQLRKKAEKIRNSPKKKIIREDVFERKRDEKIIQEEEHSGEDSFPSENDDDEMDDFPTPGVSDNGFVVVTAGSDDKTKTPTYHQNVYSSAKDLEKEPFLQRERVKRYWGVSAAENVEKKKKRKLLAKKKKKQREEKKRQAKMKAHKKRLKNIKSRVRIMRKGGNLSNLKRNKGGSRQVEIYTPGSKNPTPTTPAFYSVAQEEDDQVEIGESDELDMFSDAIAMSQQYQSAEREREPKRRALKKSTGSPSSNNRKKHKISEKEKDEFVVHYTERSSVESNASSSSSGSSSGKSPNKKKKKGKQIRNVSLFVSRNVPAVIPSRKGKNSSSDSSHGSKKKDKKNFRDFLRKQRKKAVKSKTPSTPVFEICVGKTREKSEFFQVVHEGPSEVEKVSIRNEQPSQPQKSKLAVHGRKSPLKPKVKKSKGSPTVIHEEKFTIVVEGEEEEEEEETERESEKDIENNEDDDFPSYEEEFPRYESEESHSDDDVLMNELPHLDKKEDDISPSRKIADREEEQNKLSVRIEILRETIEKALGAEVFLKTYRLCRQLVEVDTVENQEHWRDLMEQYPTIRLVQHDIQHLIYCEDSFYGKPV